MIDAKKDKVVTEVLIKSRTSGGLILPEVATEPQGYGRVISVGEEVTSFADGDIIVHHSNGGMVVVLESRMLRVLKEEEVYGVLTDEKIISTLIEANLQAQEKGKVVTL